MIRKHSTGCLRRDFSNRIWILSVFIADITCPYFSVGGFLQCINMRVHLLGQESYSELFFFMLVSLIVPTIILNLITFCSIDGRLLHWYGIPFDERTCYLLFVEYVFGEWLLIAGTIVH